MINSLPLISISFALFLTSYVSPLIGGLLTFASPIFFMNYLEHPNRLKNTDIIAILAVIATAVFNPFIPPLFALIVGVPSVLIVYYHTNKTTLNPLIISPIPIFVIAFILLFTGVKTDIINIFSHSLEFLSTSANIEHLSNDQRAMLTFIKNNAHEIATHITHITPGLYFAYVALITFIANRFYYAKKQLPAFQYKIPEKMLLPLVAAGFLLLVSNTTAQIVSNNALIVLAVMSFIQGLDVLNNAFTRYNISMFLRLLTYLILFSTPVLSLILCIFGLADNWVDFNKRMQGSGDKPDDQN